MKKKNSYRAINKKVITKTVPQLIISKLCMLIGIILPLAVLLAYSMDVNFFFIIQSLSIFVLIISISAYLKGEIFYSHPSAAHHSNIVANKKTVIYKKHNKNFSFSLKNGTLQVVFSMLMIILITFLGQVIYRVMG